MKPKFFVGGNWKMNGDRKQNKELIEALNKVKYDPDSVGKIKSQPFLNIW